MTLHPAKMSKGDLWVSRLTWAMVALSIVAVVGILLMGCTASEIGCPSGSCDGRSVEVGR